MPPAAPCTLMCRAGSRMTRLMSWPGATQTATSGANCSVTVTAPALRSLGPGGPLRPGRAGRASRTGRTRRAQQCCRTDLPQSPGSIGTNSARTSAQTPRTRAFGDRRLVRLGRPTAELARFAVTPRQVSRMPGNSGVMRQLRAGVSAEFGRPSADFTTKSVGPRSSIQRGDSYSLAVSSASARTISIPTASRSRAASAALETTLRGVWFILLREKGESYGVEEADDRKSDEGIPPVIRDSDE